MALAGERVVELKNLMLDDIKKNHPGVKVPPGFDIDDWGVGQAARDLIGAYKDHLRGAHSIDLGTYHGFDEKLRDYLDELRPEPAVSSFVPPVATPMPTRSEFAIVDAEGAPQHADGTGIRWHAGIDWHAPGGTKIVSPEAGVVVESHDTGDTSGQVYGGTVRVRVAYGPRAGWVWVFRHVTKPVAAGTVVKAGDYLAQVSPWQDAPSATHTHIELWRSWAFGTAGYFVDNMTDPLPVLHQAQTA